jgi:hypothetical protein
MRQFVFAVCLLLVPSLATAQQMAGDLVVLRPWSRATAPGAETGILYLSIANKGAMADRLVDVSTDVAATAEIHESTMGSGGVMKMEGMGKGVALPPGKTVTLKPGGMHIMLMGLKRQLKAGDTVPLVLTFEKAGKVSANAEVTTAGAAGPPS